MNNPKKKLQMNQKHTNAVSFPRTFLMQKKELMTLTPLMYFPDVYMNFNARAPILHFQLIAKQQKVQLHVFEHNSTHTGKFEVSNQAKGVGEGQGNLHLRLYHLRRQYTRLETWAKWT